MTDTCTPATKSTPPRAVRLHCQWCCNGQSGTSAVKGCNSPSYSLYAWRLGGPSKLIPSQTPPADPLPDDASAGLRQRAGRSRLAAIRLRCLDCALYPYRMGHNPNMADRKPNLAGLQAARSKRPVRLAVSARQIALNAEGVSEGGSESDALQIATRPVSRGKRD
jgi:hypothetical protein